MATTYKVRYKNYCIPQEQISSGGKYYLDSDCGRKLSGDSETATSVSAAGTLVAGKEINTTAQQIATNVDFVYIKNIGSTDALVSLDGGSGSAAATYRIKLSANEAFASSVNTSADIRVKTDSGTTLIEYFSET